MPTRSNISRKQAHFWIPTTDNVFCKITIVGDDTTTYTVLDSYGGAAASNYTLSASITRATDRLCSFRMTLDNNDGRYLDVFNGGERVSFYIDYTNATTIQFTGLIDNVSYKADSSSGYTIEIDGRAYPKIADRTVIGLHAGAKADEALSDLLYNYFSDVTLQYWNGTEWCSASYDSVSHTVTWTPTATGFPTTQIYMSYQHKKGFQVIQDICERAGLDFYFEYSSGWLLRLVTKNTKTNTNCGVAYGMNLFSVSDYGVDNGDVYNKITIYGKQESDNIILLKTKDNAASQSNLWIKEKVIKENDITDMDEIDNRATTELATGIDTTSTGKLSCVLLPSLRPGDVISCAVPYCGVNGTYTVRSFTHSIGNQFVTSVELSKNKDNIAKMFIPKVNPEEFVSGDTNPNKMKDSYTVYFNESPSKMTHYQTEEVSGRLKLQSGYTTGYAYAQTKTLDYDVRYCEFRRYENYETANDVYYVSNDGGATWEIYSSASGNIHQFATANSLVTFKIELNRLSSTATSPTYEAVCLLVKD